MRKIILTKKLVALLLVLLYVVSALIMLRFRQQTGYMTPDETNFYYNNYVYRTPDITFRLGGVSGQLHIKYLISSVIFQFFIKLGGINLIYYFNIFVVAIAFYLSYNAFVINRKIVKPTTWVLLFMLPNILFFSVSVLRDIYAFALVVCLLVLYKTDLKRKMVTYFILLSIFAIRPELGITVTMAYFLSGLKKRSFKRNIIFLYLFFSMLFLVYLGAHTNYYQDRFFRSVYQFREFGILGFNRPDVPIPLYLISNVFLFYFPVTSEYFFRTRFGNLMLITAVINFVIFFKIFFRYGFSLNSKDKLANFAALNLILFIPITAHESDSSAAVRHVIYMLPFVFIYFGIHQKRGKLQENQNRMINHV
jgi:hypothetical protein